MRAKISSYKKSNNYKIILAEKEKESKPGIWYVAFCFLVFFLCGSFFPPAVPHIFLLFWHKLFVQPHGEPDLKTDQLFL